jgi:hypothetical protein
MHVKVLQDELCIQAITTFEDSSSDFAAMQVPK